MRSAFLIAILVGAGGAALTLAASHAGEQDHGNIESGHYLVTAGDCTACHTVTGSGREFAGGRPIETPFGNIMAANITPDRDTGIGGWTEQQFVDAVRKGVRPDGSRLYPAMPYPNYTKMPREDVVAIFDYLKTIKPVHNKVDRSTLPFPFNVRAGMHAWDALFFSPGVYKPDPNKSAEWNRGAFLVKGPGHCGGCHTPKNVAGADKDSKALQGARLQGWHAPNITNDQNNGLGGWSVEDIAQYLKTGHNRITAATGLMAEEIKHASSKMTDADLKAIATYLKSMPGAKETKAAAIPADDPVMKAGHAIYRDQCAACHMIDGKGVPHLFPALADASVLRSSDPRTAIRLVLRGARTVATKQEPTGPGMPSYSHMLSDKEIAAVLTYARNAWGRAAPAVSASDVAKARRELEARND
jgi:mono/diheme cytochrome c family protein